jgi:hypothetical protein
MDVTEDMKKRWGVMVDRQTGIKRARVLDQVYLAFSVSGLGFRV